MLNRNDIPKEVIEEPQSTALIGDVDAFLAYCESGEAFLDWHTLIDRIWKNIEDGLIRYG